MVKSRPLRKKDNVNEHGYNSGSNDLISASSFRSNRTRTNGPKKQEDVGEGQSHKVRERNVQQKKRPANNPKSRKKAIKNETGKQRFDRLNMKREQNKKKGGSQAIPEEIKIERRNARNERSRRRVLKETPEQRENRLKYMRERQKLRIKSETAEQRSKRLKKMRDYQAKNSNSDAVLERMRERQKQRLEAETFEQRERRLEKLKLYQRKRSGKRRKKVPKITSKGQDKIIHKEDDDVVAGGSNEMQENRNHSSLVEGYHPFKVRRYGRKRTQLEEKPDGAGREGEDPLRTDGSVDDSSPANMPD